MKFFLAYLLFFCFYFNNLINAQIDSSQIKNNDTLAVQIININQTRNIKTADGAIQELLGSVQLKQQSAYLWADTAFLYPDKSVKAHGNVEIDQNDSIHVFSDSLFYSGINRVVRLKKEVVLQDSTATIFTELLDYHLSTRMAYFPNDILVLSDSNELIAKRGSYNANNNTVFFYDSVRGTTPNFKLISDSLSFNTATEKAIFLGKTMIYDQEKIIYAEGGYYDGKKQEAVFAKNAYYLNRSNGKTEKATGDSIIYDGKKKMYYLVGNAQFNDGKQQVNADSIYFDQTTESYSFRGKPVFKSLDSSQTQQIQAGNSNYDKATGNMIFTDGVLVNDKNKQLQSRQLVYNESKKTGFARGDVRFVDSSSSSILEAGALDYNDSSKILLAFDSPVLTNIIDKDSLWIRADTFYSFVDTFYNPTNTAKNEEIRHFKGFYQVKMFKSNLQALADSMFYNGKDSLFSLYSNPIMWADTVQFSADTIRFLLKNKQLQHIFLRENSLIVDCEDDFYYNQIKGKNINANFDSSKISSVDVLSSGEAVYYVKDQQSKYIGVNRVECGNMFIYFADSQIKKLKFVTEPNAAMTSMGKTSHETLRLKNFKWLENQRPKSKADIYND
jgi:lipopolysaccharide export system protein LptA